MAAWPSDGCPSLQAPWSLANSCSHPTMGRTMFYSGIHVLPAQAHTYTFPAAPSLECRILPPSLKTQIKFHPHKTFNSHCVDSCVAPAAPWSYQMG